MSVMSDGHFRLGLLVLAVHAVIGTGEGPKPFNQSTPLSITTSTKASILQDNDLAVTFHPLDALVYGSDAPEKYFGTVNNTVVTSQVGSTALIPCVIHNIGDGIVSWIRRKDYHLLTVGLTTYSWDQRFQAIHLQHSEDWTLKIRFVQKRDAGTFECQVSSHPPTSIFLKLDVVEARAQISGPTEKYLKPGSTLRLQCSVVQTTEAPAFVFWYHNSRMINYDVEKGVIVSTDPSQRVSDLLIPNASTLNAGNYSCVPNNAVPASIYVHIINGENPAAMQSSATDFWNLFTCRFALLPFSMSLNLVILR